MKEIDINKLLDSLSIDKISNIKNYNGTPSVTGILSLIDGYMPDNNEELERGTRVHKMIEDYLTTGKITKRSYNTDRAFLNSFICGFELFEKLRNNSNLKVEQQLVIEGVLGGTIDILANNIIDIKTSNQEKISKQLLEKYEYQIEGYKILCRAFGIAKYLKPEIYHLSSYGIDVYNVTNNIDNKMRILLFIYHIIKGNINSILILILSSHSLCNSEYYAIFNHKIFKGLKGNSKLCIDFITVFIEQGLSKSMQIYNKDIKYDDQLLYFIYKSGLLHYDLPAESKITEKAINEGYTNYKKILNDSLIKTNKMNSNNNSKTNLKKKIVNTGNQNYEVDISDIPELNTGDSVVYATDNIRRYSDNMPF